MYYLLLFILILNNTSTGALKASANNKTSESFKKQLPDSILLIEVRFISNLTIWRRVASISWIIFFVLYHID